MSSIVSRCSRGANADQAPERERASSVWPASLRGFLAAVTVTTALGLGVASRSVRSSSDGGSAEFPDLVLDPNAAPRQVLMALPHAGPTLVARLVEAREARPFASAEDARHRVIGLGPTTVAKLAPHLRFHTASGPVRHDDANTLDWQAVVAKKPVARRAKARLKKVTSLPTRLTSLDTKTDFFQ
jgi:competence protein ComEA